MSAEARVPGSAYVKGCVSPLCFDTPAIADTPRWAADGFRGALFGFPANSFVYKMQSELKLATREAQLRIRRSKVDATKLQKTYNECIRKRCIDDDISSTIRALMERNFGVL